MKRKINFSIVVIVLISVLSIFVVSAQTYNCPMGGYGGMMYGLYGGSAMALGWVISLLVIALIIAAIYWLIKSAQKKR